MSSCNILEILLLLLLKTVMETQLVTEGATRSTLNPVFLWGGVNRGLNMLHFWTL